MLIIFALEISMNKYTFNIFVISQLIDSSFVSNRSFFGNCTIYMYNNKWIEKNHTSSQFSSQTCFDTLENSWQFVLFWLKNRRRYEVLKKMPTFSMYKFGWFGNFWLDQIPIRAWLLQNGLPALTKNPFPSRFFLHSVQLKHWLW